MLQRYFAVLFKCLRRRQEQSPIVCIKRMRRRDGTHTVTCAVVSHITPVLLLERQSVIQSLVWFGVKKSSKSPRHDGASVQQCCMISILKGQMETSHLTKRISCLDECYIAYS